jgi:hypothetical protein
MVSKSKVAASVTSFMDLDYRTDLDAVWRAPSGRRFSQHCGAAGLRLYSTDRRALYSWPRRPGMLVRLALLRSQITAMDVAGNRMVKYIDPRHLQRHPEQGNHS